MKDAAIDKRAVRARLAPEVRELLEYVDGHPNSEGLALPELRQRLLQADNAFFRRDGSAAPEVAGVDDYRVPVAGGEIALRLYRPAGDGPHPVFVHLHGGGFVFGSIDQLFYDDKCREISVGCHCVVAAVEYRLAPEHRFPTAPEDCLAALRFASDNAADLGLDPTRIAVGGDSAGGNLAAAVALMARDAGGPQLVLQLLEIPVVDNAEPERYASWEEFGRGYGLENDVGDLIREAYFANAEDAFKPYASPIRAADLSGLAPAHVMTAEFDILRDSGEEYGERLREAGVPTTVRRYAGHVHGSAFLFRTWRPARLWIDDIIVRLTAAFG